MGPEQAELTKRSRRRQTSPPVHVRSGIWPRTSHRISRQARLRSTGEVGAVHKLEDKLSMGRVQLEYHLPRARQTGKHAVMYQKRRRLAADSWEPKLGRPRQSEECGPMDSQWAAGEGMSSASHLTEGASTERELFYAQIDGSAYHDVDPCMEERGGDVERALRPCRLQASGPLIAAGTAGPRGRNGTPANGQNGRENSYRPVSPDVEIVHKNHSLAPPIEGYERVLHSGPLVDCEASFVKSGPGRTCQQRRRQLSRLEAVKDHAGTAIIKRYNKEGDLNKK